MGARGVAAFTDGRTVVPVDRAPKLSTGMGEKTTTMRETQPLLTPVQVGPYTLPNRIVMAPMTRARATNPECAATTLHALKKQKS